MRGGLTPQEGGLTASEETTIGMLEAQQRRFQTMEEPKPMIQEVMSNILHNVKTTLMKDIKPHLAEVLVAALIIAAGLAVLAVVEVMSNLGLTM